MAWSDETWDQEIKDALETMLLVVDPTSKVHEIAPSEIDPAELDVLFTSSGDETTPYNAWFILPQLADGDRSGGWNEWTLRVRLEFYFQAGWDTTSPATFTSYQRFLKTVVGALREIGKHAQLGDAAVDDITGDPIVSVAGVPSWTMTDEGYVGDQFCHLAAIEVPLLLTEQVVLI